MSLRKSPQLTSSLLAAARRNARHSTGPRSPAGKRNSKLNALKHGAYVCPENQRESMLALGEDPERFQALSEELKSAFTPGDALHEKQVEDLAWLYWRRERLERALCGLKRRALQGSRSGNIAASRRWRASPSTPPGTSCWTGICRRRTTAC